MLRSGRLQSRQVAGRARGAGLPAPGLAEGRAHCGANRVGACCGEGQGAEQAHLAGEEGRSSRSPMDQKTYNNRSVTRSGLRGVSQRVVTYTCLGPQLISRGELDLPGKARVVLCSQVVQDRPITFLKRLASCLRVYCL